MAKDQLPDADVIFMPYNYLLDEKARSAQLGSLAQAPVLDALAADPSPSTEAPTGASTGGGLKAFFDNAVILFDEAHNLASVCADATSFTLTALDLATALDDTQHALDALADTDASPALAALATASGLDADALLLLKALLLRLAQRLDATPLRTHPGFDAPVHVGDGAWLLAFFSACGVVPGNVGSFLVLAEACIQFLMKCKRHLCMCVCVSTLPSFYGGRVDEYQQQGARGGGSSGKSGAALQHVVDAVKKVFGTHGKGAAAHDLSHYYKVHLSDPPPAKDAPTAATRKLSYWCMSPGVALTSLAALGPRALLLTSGTLAPLASFAAEFHLPFPHVLQNPHVIAPHQLLATVIPTGPTGHRLTSAYTQRHDPAYRQDLALALLRVAAASPDGLLVFFPSYSVMTDLCAHWQRTGVYARLHACKPLFTEPRQKHDLPAVMAAYDDAIARGGGRGAMLFAVCRGKLSEGVDFADAKARTVVVTGIPYPPYKDDRVTLKRQYLDAARARAPSAVRPPHAASRGLIPSV